MKLQTNIIITLLLFSISYSYGQMQSYEYKREVKGIQDQWHKVVLPETMFGTLSRKLTDIRLYGITKDNDTIEAPYILQKSKDHTVTKDVEFTIINTSHNNDGYFYTFEVPSETAINQINLDFGQQNYDWQLTLEGSQNQQEWFKIVNDYRIVSIKNELTDFTFNTLSFPSSKYTYFRLRVSSKVAPDLQKVSISQQDTEQGTLKKYGITSQKLLENKQAKQTEISIELQHAVPISYVKIIPTESFDYYRPVTIKYLADSVHTEQGWKYSYRTLTSGVLNSKGKNEFKASSTTLKKLKILVHNQDNQPLDIGAIKIQGYTHELIARFTEPATYFLTYGNKNARRPTYDIANFKENIPTSLTALILDEEQAIQKDTTPSIAPLFENKLWLWGIMGLLILILGGFSLKMIKQK